MKLYKKYLNILIKNAKHMSQCDLPLSFFFKLVLNVDIIISVFKFCCMFYLYAVNALVKNNVICTLVNIPNFFFNIRCL